MDAVRRRRAFDEAMADGFARVAFVLAGLFTVFTVLHLFEFSPSTARVMVPLAASTAVLAAATGIVVSWRGLRPGVAHPVAAALGCLVYLNCVVQLSLTGEPHLTVNVLLLVIAVGVCVVDPLWLGCIAGGMALSWVPFTARWTDASVSRTIIDLTTAGVVAAIANITRRRSLLRQLAVEQELRWLSERCELTGLLNRRGFLDVAQRRMTEGPVTVWFLDVDELKVINDRYGHDTGDLLIVEVAQALEDVFAGETVARLSGDEFAVLHEPTTPAGLGARSAALVDRLADVDVVPGHVVRVSTGATTSVPGQTLSEVLAVADAAMYVRKAARRAAPTGGPDPVAQAVGTGRVEASTLR